MNRTTIEAILSGAAGVEKKDEGYAVADEHQASIYIGGKGPTTVLSELVGLKLHEDYIEAIAKDRTHYVLYDPILGLSLRRPREESGRTGF